MSRIRGFASAFGRAEVEARNVRTGEVDWRWEKRNKLLLPGFALLLNSALSGQTENGEVFSRIAVGTGSTASDETDTALQTEIERIPVATWVPAPGTVNPVCFSAYALFGPEEAIGSVNEVGLVNNVLGTFLNRAVADELVPAGPHVKTVEQTLSVLIEICVELNTEPPESSPEASPEASP